MRRVLLGTVVPLAFVLAGVAHADDLGGVSATASAAYAFGVDKGTSNAYGFNGSIKVPVFDVGLPDAGFEIVGGYHRPDSGGTDFWNIGGALYGASENGRAAVSGRYHSIGAATFGTYGAGGEWYAGQSLSLALRGGGVAWDHVGGGYAGGQAVWNATPDFALSGGVDYWSAGYVMTTATAQAEWLPFETTPVSFYAGYQNNNVHGVNWGMAFVGVKFYLDGGAATTLVERQRHDANGYITQSPVQLDRY